jgi:hypothetical protein
MFKNNKYTKWYNNIIFNRRQNPLNNSVYQEKHHIIPKSLGGSNKKENIVSLTAREHFICHRLLVKMTEGKNKAKMSYAIRTMMNRENPYQKRYKVTSKTYELIIRETKEIIGKFLKGENNPYYGKTHSNEVRTLMKEKRKLQDPPMLGKSHNEKTKFKLRKANQKQFEDPQQIELRKQKSKKQFEDPVNRYKAGNGKRGKSWFYDPTTNHSILCFPNEKPHNYVKGRIIKK